MEEPKKAPIPEDLEEMMDYHLGDHAVVLEMLHTMAEHMGVYFQPVITGDESVAYEMKPIKSPNKNTIRLNTMNEEKKNKCKHEGYWFSVKVFVFRRKFLWCETCLQAIPKTEVLKNADILHHSGNKFYSYYPL